MGFFDFIQSNVVYFILALLVIQFISIFFVIHVNMKYNRLKRSYRSFMKGKDGKNLEESVLEKFSQVESVMKEAKKMQSDVEKSQEELAAKEFEASAGGEAVKVKVSGSKQIKEIKIKPEVLEPDDVEMLEDLIATCINNALKQVDDAQAASLGKYNIPGLM